MSKIDSSGIEHGKRGGKVYQEVRGQQIVKNLYKPTNPRSPKQQQHRAKLAFINRLSAHLAEAVNIGFARVPDADVKHTPRNAFVKKNWDNGALLWNEETALWELCPERLKVADGPRYIPDNMTAEVSDGRLYITCPDPGLSQKNAVADERLLILVYWPDASMSCLYSGPPAERLLKILHHPARGTMFGTGHNARLCLVPGPLLPPRYRRPRPCLHRLRQSQPVSGDVWVIHGFFLQYWFPTIP